jgi:hypothetical protein
MSKVNRAAEICCVSIGVLILAASAQAQTRPAIAKQIADVYGLDSFDQVEAIRYTFHLKAPAGQSVSRSWIWEPKTDQVSYEGKDKKGNPVKVTYLRSQVDSQPANVKTEIDPAFVNDQYTLLFPLHVYWDSWADVQDVGAQKLPLGKGTADKVVVKYPSDGGYTPGDTWDLYIGPDKRVLEFAYHRHGSGQPKLVTAKWEDYKKAGPLLFSTNRPGKANHIIPARVYYTDVAVKVVGSDTWVNAQ